MNFRHLRGALGAAALVFAVQAAQAHAVLERREARAGAFYRGVIQITHGCKDSATTSVRVTIPEGAVGARPMAKPGWTISTTKGPYARTYPFVHGSLSEGVTEIAWSGSRLPADEFDEFVFSVRLSDDLPEGPMYFPVVQTCERGEYRWVEIPKAGRDAQAPAEPAPSVRVVAADRASTTAAMGPAPVKAGDLTIEQPWLRATPAGAKVAGGYLRITNNGPVADRLLSTSIPVAGRGEVHEMSTEGGVVRMSEVAGGLEIGPGQGVELKPGGFHLMFLDLTSGLKQGDTVRGTLTFARAGTVEVVFAVAPIGAPGPAAGHSHH